MAVTHYPPRRQTHITRKQHNSQLAWCFIASVVFMAIPVVFMAILAIVSLAFGAVDHPFPFKTLEDITTGTPAWVIDGLPDQRYCPGTTAGVISKFQYQSGAGSIWTVYTDGKVFSAAYFPPGSAKPVAVVEGHVVDGTQLVIEKNVAYDPEKHRPCDPWTRKSTRGSDGC